MAHTPSPEPAVNLKPPFAALAAAVALALSSGPAAADPELKIPDFSHLREIATDSVDVTLDGFLLRIASKFAEADSSPEAQAGASLLRGLKSVRVRNFTFDSDDAYSRADVESVRKQLTGPDWSALVQVRKREAKENVDVYICMEGDKATGLAVIASEPREFTIVNIIGSIDVDKIGQLQGQFGIPELEENP
jgi:hypothetical protein